MTSQFAADEERAAFVGMKDEEIVAYWNILQLSGRCFQVDPENRGLRHDGLVAAELSKRGIPHENGKLIGRRPGGR